MERHPSVAWSRLVAIGLAIFLWPDTVDAQLAPTGAHYAGRPTDTGHAGPTDSGGYAASVPLDLPSSRGGLPIPVQIVSGTKGVGAAGLGWDVPLSFVHVDTFIAGHRPTYAPGEPVAARQRITVSLPGRRVEMLPQGAAASRCSIFDTRS